MLEGKILITGGAGTLGRAIIKRSTEDKWPCQITIFSTDAIKHAFVREQYPHVQSVIGDIRSYDAVYNAMAGKDIVIHGAAVKHIPVSEYNSIDTYEINVEGSRNVCMAAIQHHTPHVLGISTDKACHPANAYGATKMLMEKIFQEYARLGFSTQFHLVRYGNVLESTGSVIQVWKKAIEDHQPIKMTDPEMTRFWLSPDQAVTLVLKSLELQSGHIYVAKMPALSIRRLAEYGLGLETLEEMSVEIIPLRPGEKTHEELLTVEECPYATEYRDHYDLRPSTDVRYLPHCAAHKYSSDEPDRELRMKELQEMLDNG